MDVCRHRCTAQRSTAGAIHTVITATSFSACCMKPRSRCSPFAIHHPRLRNPKPSPRPQPPKTASALFVSPSRLEVLPLGWAQVSYHDHIQIDRCGSHTRLLSNIDWQNTSFVQHSNTGAPGTGHATESAECLPTHHGRQRG